MNMPPTFNLQYILKRHKEPVVVLAVLVLSGVLAFAGKGNIANGLLLVMGIIGVLPIIHDMIKSIRAGEYGVDILAVVAILSALALKEYLAAGIILLMLTGGEALEDYAQERAKKELNDLLKRAPKIAHRKIKGGEEDIAVQDIKVGDIIIVKPGEVVPVDGIIKVGESSFDESALTGESLPVERGPKGALLSGSVNQLAAIEMLATATSHDSQYEKIIHLVEEAASSRSPLVRLADQYSLPFTLVSFTIAGLAWLVSADPLRFLQVLVVATPCPLLIATPVALVSGMSRAARHGIIVKNGAALEQLSRLKAIVFDKTGTLTKGAPHVEDVLPQPQTDFTEKQILQLAASVEQASAHTLGTAVVNEAKRRKLKINKASEVEETVGQGITGIVGGRYVSVGKLGYLQYLGALFPKRFTDYHHSIETQGKTGVFVAIEGVYAGVITFADQIRDETVETLQQISKLGIEDIAMVTGDHYQVAQRIADELELSQVHADQLPQDKLKVVKRLKRAHTPLAFVGDGVNDAPVLAASDVGIALGAKGSTAASESADVVIMLDDLKRVPMAINISRRTLRVARESIFVGIGLSLVLMLIAATGRIKPLNGALLQEVIDIIVIINALRARHGRQI
jgi:heavy metal translocating P-type ATPase